MRVTSFLNILEANGAVPPVPVMAGLSNHDTDPTLAVIELPGGVGQYAIQISELKAALDNAARANKTVYTVTAVGG